jgi:hypothetical protein
LLMALTEYSFRSVVALMTVYACAALALSIWAWRSGPREVDLGACVRCGYSLYGLDEPRCPECGTAFDPRLMLSLTPLGPLSRRSGVPPAGTARGTPR